MKKGFMVIFSLSLLLSVAQPALGECSMGTKNWDEKTKSCCSKTRRFPDVKESANLLTKAGMIASMTLAVDYLFSKAVKTEFISNKMPFAQYSYLISKVCTLLVSAGIGACLVKNKVDKKILSFFECC